MIHSKQFVILLSSRLPSPSPSNARVLSLSLSFPPSFALPPTRTYMHANGSHLCDDISHISLQHVATRCNTLRHTATHLRIVTYTHAHARTWSLLCDDISLSAFLCFFAVFICLCCVLLGLLCVFCVSLFSVCICLFRVCISSSVCFHVSFACC